MNAYKASSFALRRASQVLCISGSLSRRQFHISRRANTVKPFLLADIGEGITECQLIQWFVQPGARVEQFDKLCEVQSDKASVEITSPFDGVIKRLHYEPDDMAITGKPLVDIDIQEDINTAVDVGLGDDHNASKAPAASSSTKLKDSDSPRSPPAATQREASQRGPLNNGSRPSRGDMGSLATPAVRHLIKELDVKIVDIKGSGRDGRVLKEDVQNHVARRSQQVPTSTIEHTEVRPDRTQPLTPVQNAMFKVMTRSLSIPHFLYSCSADMSAISTLRTKLNASSSSTSEAKITHLAFIVKAVSIAFSHHSLLNASLDTCDPKKPVLTYRGSHDFGIAIDTPAGLVVPVLRKVQSLSIAEIALGMRNLSEAARNNKLTPTDFGGASFTLSNIGSVGGGVVAPVISEPQVAIVGIGRSRVVPAFDGQGQLTKREELVFSWSADHRVVDGAECARCAERVKNLLEEPSLMMMELR
jgi:2-oxoisovalerate dehydrogenase E2 component (dihydrolipoyl transacylase)